LIHPSSVLAPKQRRSHIAAATAATLLGAPAIVHAGITLNTID
jgi:hypothetical protein